MSDPVTFVIVIASVILVVGIALLLLLKKGIDFLIVYQANTIILNSSNKQLKQFYLHLIAQQVSVDFIKGLAPNLIDKSLLIAIAVRYHRQDIIDWLRPDNKKEIQIYIDHLEYIKKETKLQKAHDELVANKTHHDIINQNTRVKFKHAKTPEVINIG